MASEIRVNKIENRSGLGTVTFADTGVDLAGIVTATTFSGSGANLTNLPAANITGTLPAISGANLTGIDTDLVSDTSPQLGGDLDTNDFEILLDDNHKIKFGAGNDLTIESDGTNGLIKNHVGGAIYIRANTDVQLMTNASDGGADSAVKCVNNGAVELYHDGTKQCETSANGLAFPAGKGIDFSAQTATSTSGASTTAEVLDHYEEGTWTAYLHNVSAPTYEAQGGVYTRIGRMVFCDCTIGVASGMDNSDGSGFNIKGLPFNGSQAGGDVCHFSLGRYTNLLGDKQDNVENARFIGDGLILMEGNNDSITYSEINSSGYLQISFAYMMA